MTGMFAFAASSDKFDSLIYAGLFSGVVQWKFRYGMFRGLDKAKVFLRKVFLLYLLNGGTYTTKEIKEYENIVSYLTGIF